MGKYIKLFSSHSDYEDFVETTDFVLPNVSRCDSEKDVHYNPTPKGYYDYLTFTALEEGKMNFNIGLVVNTDSLSYVEYSIDDGITWTRLTNSDNKLVNILTPTINTGDSVLWRGSGIRLCSAWYDSTNYQCTFYSNFLCIVSGNILSLLYLDDFGKNLISENAFINLFKNMNKLISAENLVLPSTTALRCFCSMFNGCTSLTTAPELPSATLANSCYYKMFYGCTSLTTVPSILPATTLTDSCYMYMFYNCTSLTTAPELPATTLVDDCYYRMFQGCSSLNYIKALFTTTPSTSYTNNWVNGVATNGTFIKNSAALWNITGVSGVPTNWTIQTANP